MEEPSSFAPVASVNDGYDDLNKPASRAKGKFKKAAGTAKQAIDEFKEASQEALSDTTTLVKENLGVGKHKAQAAYGEAKVKATDRFGQLEDQVRERPGPALAIAAGAGVLLGLLLRGRSKVVYREAP
jgi:ElaB/YqjD/DUF883 family membrane-anchored ribosome-binding protein